MEHVIAIGIGLVIGIPAALLAYRYTRRSQPRGYDSGYVGGDYSSGGVNSSSGGDGADSSP